MVSGRGADGGARRRRRSLRGRLDRWGFFRGPKEDRCRRWRRHTWRTARSRRPRRRSVGLRAEDPARRPQVLRPVRKLAAHDASDRRVRHVGVQRGPRLRRLLDPRLAGDRRERPPAHARPGKRSSTPSRPRRRSRSSARSPTRRPARPTDATRGASPGGRSPTCGDRHRRHGLLRPRVRVLRLRRGLLRALPHRSHYAVDSAEGHWNSVPGLGYTVREKGGYFPPAPHDTLHDLRSEIVLTLERLGIPCEFHHHEVATAASARSTSATSR